MIRKVYRRVKITDDRQLALIAEEVKRQHRNDIALLNALLAELYRTRIVLVPRQQQVVEVTEVILIEEYYGG